MYKIRLLSNVAGPNLPRLFRAGEVVTVPDDIPTMEADVLIQLGQAEFVDNAPLGAGDTIGLARPQIGGLQMNNKSIPKSKPSTQAVPGPKKPIKPPLDKTTPPKRTPCGGTFNPN